MIALEVEREAGGWGEDAEAVARRAADAVAAALASARPGESRGPGALGLAPGFRREEREGFAATLLLTDDAAIRELNRAWRGKDAPTNVLSFPAPPQPARAGTPRHLGDVALAYETVAAEAGRDGRPIADHLAHLVVHGLLHLLGHDHERDDEADAMEAAETAVLARLGVPDPHAAEAAP